MTGRRVRYVLRAWVLEPLVAGYAAAGFVAVQILMHAPAADLDGAVLNAVALRVALVMSCWRAVIHPYLRNALGRSGGRASDN